MRLSNFRVTTAFAGLMAGAAVVSTVGITAPARALGPGSVCMFKAPSGATYGVVDAGHVGWAYEVGNSGTWVFGATEVADGKPESTWIKNGDWNAVLSTFKSGAGFHGTGYYTEYRCRNTSSSSVGAANKQAEHEKNDGYELDDNNCLTKSVLIFNAYGVNDLPLAGFTFPNYYFDKELFNFDPARKL